MITRERIRLLLEEAPAPVLSLYHPTAQIAVEPEENSLHLKNVLQDAHRRLSDSGMRRTQIDSFLAPLERLLDDADFWRHQRRGLALFRSDDSLREFKLPVYVEAAAVVADAPYIRPLLPALSSEEPFYVLAVSLNEVRLLECTDDAVERIALEPLEIPQGLRESLRYDDLQKPEQLSHPTTGPGRVPGGAGGMHAFHGHGEVNDTRKEQIRRYFAAIDAGIVRFFGARPRPTILAAVDYLHALYRDVSKYPALIEGAVEGSPDGLRDEQLRDRGKVVVDEMRARDLAALLERYLEQEAHGRAGCGAEEVLNAAADGRIDTLLLLQNAPEWGTFDVAERTFAAGRDVAGAIDLHDLAARLTLSIDGHIRVLSAGAMPCPEPVAAIYRY